MRTRSSSLSSLSSPTSSPSAAGSSRICASQRSAGRAPSRACAAPASSSSRWPRLVSRRSPSRSAASRGWLPSAENSWRSAASGPASDHCRRACASICTASTSARSARSSCEGDADCASRASSGRSTIAVAKAERTSAPSEGSAIAAITRISSSHSRESSTLSREISAAPMPARASSRLISDPSVCELTSTATSRGSSARPSIEAACADSSRAISATQALAASSRARDLSSMVSGAPADSLTTVSGARCGPRARSRKPARGLAPSRDGEKPISGARKGRSRSNSVLTASISGATERWFSCSAWQSGAALRASR